MKSWTAEKSIKSINGNTVETWHVQDCPEFEKDRPEDETCGNGSEDAYVRIAEIVLREQIGCYQAALRRYAKARTEDNRIHVESIERELRTPYYHALAMGLVDFAAYIAEQRKAYDVPEKTDP